MWEEKKKEKKKQRTDILFLKFGKKSIPIFCRHCRILRDESKSNRESDKKKMYFGQFTLYHELLDVVNGMDIAHGIVDDSPHLYHHQNRKVARERYYFEAFVSSHARNSIPLH